MAFLELGKAFQRNLKVHFSTNTTNPKEIFIQFVASNQAHRCLKTFQLYFAGNSLQTLQSRNQRPFQSLVFPHLWDGSSSSYLKFSTSVLALSLQAGKAQERTICFKKLCRTLNIYQILLEKKNSHLLNLYIQGALNIIPGTIQRFAFYLHFMNKEARAQRDLVIYPILLSKL